MLVLTRKQQEQIRIGNQVTVTILRINGNQVRIGIEAPPDVRILRGELSAHSDEPHADSAADSKKEPTTVQLTVPSSSSARSELIEAIRQRLAGAVC